MALTFDFINPDGDNTPEIVLNAHFGTSAEKILLYNIAKGKYGNPAIISSKLKNGAATECVIGFSSSSLLPEIIFPEAKISWKGSSSEEYIFGNIHYYLPEDIEVFKNISQQDLEFSVPSLRKRLYLTIPEFEKIQAFSPILKIEGYRKAKIRTKYSSEAGWRELPNRVTDIPILSAKQEIVFDPEKYFRFSPNLSLIFPASAKGSNRQGYTKIRFRIAVTINGKQIVSAPFGKLQVLTVGDGAKINIYYKMI
ncbi:MAG: hypothetical protein LBE36_06345 [Flavobacteriaceae bacterium]|jgi:hypothetical protein|nr:hypothetical protein [Flavobacteriaceae bacterium]